MIVDISTGGVVDKPEGQARTHTAVALGRLGGQKGGRVRAEKLRAAKRKAIAKKAALARWVKT